MDRQIGSVIGGDADCAPHGATMTRRPWDGHYPPGLSWSAPIETGTVPELLDRAAAQHGARPAIEYCDRTLSYAELGRLADRFAAGLLRAGIGRDRTVALFLPNTPWHTVAFFGALKAGCRLAHLSPLDAPRELVHKLTDSGADVLITTDLFGMAEAAVPRLRAAVRLAHVFVGADAFWGGAPAAGALPEGGGSLETLLEAEVPAHWPAVGPDDVALLQYTGGTTGLPKGAMLTHRNLTAATSIYRSWRDENMPPPGTQRVIAVLPMFHVYALGVILLLGVAEGEQILLRPRFDIAATIDDIERKRATTFPAVPTMLVALLAAPEVERRDLSSLRWVGSGGAPLPTEVAARVESLTRTPMRTGWGMTETAAAGTRVPAGVAMTPGLIGVPLPGVDLRVVSLDDPSRVLPPGEVGEIAVCGPNVFEGYWNGGDLNRTGFADGFFLTGDIGRMDETGLFTLVDRKKRLIISGGFNVYPNIIENALFEHPDIEEAIVIGVPDEYRGEAAKAFVTLRAGAQAPTLDGLRAFLADKLGRHELPAALEIRESLPKSPVGKLLASRLVEEERAKLALNF